MYHAREVDFHRDEIRMSKETAMEGVDQLRKLRRDFFEGVQRSDHLAPVAFKTTFTVLARIWKSSVGKRFLM